MRQHLKNRLTPGILEAIAQRKTSAKDVAKLYGVSETHLSKALKALNLQKIPAPTPEHKRKAHILMVTRTKVRQELAEKVRLGTKTIHNAAREANCSLRTMYRYVEANND
jgi:transposase